MKRKTRLGFTLIEISLFLVITGALFISVIVGVQNSIYQQRYTDSVQNFANFLRNAYSQTMNVQSNGTGRSDRAIYGKLITFGEKYDASGNPINDNDDDGTRNVIFSYDVIGNTGDIGTGNAIQSLSAANANVVIVEDGMVKPVGIIESYTPKWTASIENTNNFDLFTGALLIIRHPKSGTVYTYVMKGATIEVNQLISQTRRAYADAEAALAAAVTDEERASAANTIQEIANGTFSLLKPALDSGAFKVEDVDFCVNPQSELTTLDRRDIRIVARTRNATGVEVINADEDNRCNTD